MQQISPDVFAAITARLAQALDRHGLQVALGALIPLLVPDAEELPAERHGRGWPRGKPRGRRTKAAPQRQQPRALKQCEIKQRLPRATKWLRAELAAGAKGEQLVRSLATEQRIKPEVLTAACDELGVLQHKPTNGSEPLWRLPA